MYSRLLGQSPDKDGGRKGTRGRKKTFCEENRVGVRVNVQENEL